MKFIDLTGKKFSRLTVISRAPNKGKHSQWHCSCTCGGESIVASTSLRSGHTQSCGCLWKQVIKEASKTHGLSFTPEERTLKRIKYRCFSKKSKDYPDYGGRGITICERWLSINGVVNFVSDMGKRPSKIHSIDRIDNDGDYSPENCRWSTPKQQSNNKRNNIVITYLGKTQTLKQWSEELGIKYTLAHARIKRGWSTEKTFLTPVRGAH